MLKNSRRSLPTKPIEQRAIMTVGEYIDKKEEHRMLPAKISKRGKMRVLFHGHWITEKQLKEVLPKPIVPDFQVNLNNSDKTKAWIHL